MKKIDQISKRKNYYSRAKKGTKVINVKGNLTANEIKKLEEMQDDKYRFMSELQNYVPSSIYNSNEDIFIKPNKIEYNYRIGNENRDQVIIRESFVKFDLHIPINLN